MARHVCEVCPRRARALLTHQVCLANEHAAHENGAPSQASSHELAKSCRIICKSDGDFLSLYWLNNATGDSNARPVGRSIANGDEIRPAGRAFLRS
jgi:hypothetical protein